MNHEDFPASNPGQGSPEETEIESRPAKTAPETSNPVAEERRIQPRFEVSARVRLTIFAEVSATASAAHADTSRMRLVREGFSKDLSESGVCVVLDDRLTGVALQQLVGKKAKLNLEWNRSDHPGLKVLGQIAWGKEKDGVVKLGIQFTEMPEADRKVLEKLCQGDESELSRISNLWELLVAEPRNLSH